MNTDNNRLTIARRAAAACGAGVLFFGVAACGDAEVETQSAGTTEDQSAPTQTRAPGASGMVAALDGSTAQVQSQQSGQVAVTWGSATTFTQQVSGSLGDLAVGNCVVVTPAEASEEEGQQLVAATVRISEPIDGSCAPAGGARGGDSDRGERGERPDRADGGERPEGAPGQVRGAGVTVGTVAAVTGTGFTVAARTAPAAETAETTEIELAVGEATTYSTQAEASASDVTVGICLQAEGTSDETGALAATRVALTPAVDGACETGFAGGRQGRTS